MTMPKYHVAIDVDGAESMGASGDIFGDLGEMTGRAKAALGKSSKKEKEMEMEQDDYRASDLTVTSMVMGASRGSKKNKELTATYLGYGVVRLFREYDDSGEIEVKNDDTTVAIVAVPNYLTPTEVLAFLGESVTSEVSHFRMIKSDNANRFMTLMKFRTSEKARAFQDEFNDKPFSAIEAECCHVIFVKSVMFRPLNTANMSGIPYLLEDSFTLQVRKSSNEGEVLQTSPVVKELPTCPVCLERMDSDVTGLITISCQHTFHCNCLTKWRDDTCPVCRYSNLSLDSLRKNGPSEQLCYSCGGTQNLWICLICGNIGCGRYNKKHAIEHFERENHCFAMDIATQRVWDYAGDNYVHRLLQNQSDGKLVELPSSSASTSTSKNDDDEAKKVTNMNYSIEHSNLLLSQLESQRDYYESRLAEAADVHSQLVSERTADKDMLKKMEATTTELGKRLDSMKLEFQRSFDSQRSQLSTLTKSREDSKTYQEKWKEERLMADELSKNMDKLRLENEQLKTENNDLQEQVKDLMFYLESQDKFKDASDDVKNGTVVVHEAPVPVGNGKGKSKSKSKSKRR